MALPEGRISYSASRLAAFKACPFKFKKIQLEKIVPFVETPPMLEGTKQHKLSKKRDAYVVTSEVTGEQMATAKTPWEAVRAACAAIPNCDDAESFNAMLPDGSEIVANENGTASLYQNGAVVRAFPSARHAYEFAAQ